jgi:histone deacetylase 11
MGFWGSDKLHPFDAKKYGRAWAVLEDSLGERLANHLVKPDRPVTREDLLLIHSPRYLDQLRSAHYVAGVLEIPLVQYLPMVLINFSVLTPMRWATEGTLLATREALSSGLAVNLAGGYHHAKPAAGEGFCAYSDIALAIHEARNKGWLSPTDFIVYIDLDAHQGNGVCHFFLNDPQVHIFDIYNEEIYPAYDHIARERIDWDLPIPSMCADDEYLDLLKGNLPAFLTSVEDKGHIRLAIYNAGTDVYRGDSLGRLELSEPGILERDIFVINILRHRNIPTVMVLGGGYSRQSYKFVANTVQYLLQ